MIKETISYLFIRALLFPLAFLSPSRVHQIGKFLGTLSYYLIGSYRKRALSNLAASDLNLEEKALISTAKESFQNLAINLLEYPRFAKDTDFNDIQCVNPQIANDLYQKGQGIIFFCGHQANWETLFLDGNKRMRGIAIGKSIKNKKLYKWIVSIREKTGGKIIAPKNALKTGLKSLRAGIFMGIVGDQGMPESNYSFPFFGRRAWTSTAPALLAYKTNSPIMVATTKRIAGEYRIHYSNPIFPNLTTPLEIEVPRLMDESLTLLQESIRQTPGQWLWQHNRWKQQTPHIIYKSFRHDTVLIIIDTQTLPIVLPHLANLKKIYSKDFISLLVPEEFKDLPEFKIGEIISYQNQDELFRKDYRFKIVFNFTNIKKIKPHYKKLSAFEVLSLTDLKKIAKNQSTKDCTNISLILQNALCRPGTINLTPS